MSSAFLALRPCWSYVREEDCLMARSYSVLLMRRQRKSPSCSPRSAVVHGLPFTGVRARLDFRQQQRPRLLPQYHLNLHIAIYITASAECRSEVQTASVLSLTTWVDILQRPQRAFPHSMHFGKVALNGPLLHRHWQPRASACGSGYNVFDAGWHIRKSRLSRSSALAA